MEENTKCGFCCLHPKWLQNLATSKCFITIYGLLGMVQSMAYIYIVVSLTTLEKRFKIASQTTGILLSGNEISQILSILLIYYGSAGHRPRWISVGVGFSAVSCFVLVLPHVFYGPGQDALALTSEYLNASFATQNQEPSVGHLPICSQNSPPDSCDKIDHTDTSIIPRLFLFFSQFILGIGTTLYYGLGQTYMDDNTKKKNVPKMLGIAFSLRMVGPTLGFGLSYICLNFYIDPTLHPIIKKDDPRWLGAWWIGWIILGIIQLVFCILLAMFPRELRNSKKSKSEQDVFNESEMPLKDGMDESKNLKNVETNQSIDKPSLKEFSKAVKRLLTNKIFMFNTASGIFWILSASGYLNFSAKYLEVQFQTSSAGGSIIAGPTTMMGMVFAFLVSGMVISKYKPSARALLMWNVFIACCFSIGQITYIFLGCKTNGIKGIDFYTMQKNLTDTCNADCNCETVKYAPVCHELSSTTFFSACHAGCRSLINDNTFGKCSCASILSTNHYTALLSEKVQGGLVHVDNELVEAFQSSSDTVTAGPCKQDCFVPFTLFAIVSAVTNVLASSGRVGGVLVSYRCVETRDKSLAQGIGLMMVSLFALIPAPILYGAIMDSTCLVWDMTCKEKGNCWFYHRDDFRYYFNSTAAGLCVIGIFFDVAVWYFSKDIDLYGEKEELKKKNPRFRDSRYT